MAEPEALLVQRNEHPPLDELFDYLVDPLFVDLGGRHEQIAVEATAADGRRLDDPHGVIARAKSGEQSLVDAVGNPCRLRRVGRLLLEFRDDFLDVERDAVAARPHGVAGFGLQFGTEGGDQLFGLVVGEGFQVEDPGPIGNGSQFT